MPRDFKLPDLGEGVAEGEIVRWLVHEGDPVNEDQPMVEVMTDKATVQIPSPTKGKIGKILAKEGQVAKVGDALVTIVDSEISAKSLPASIQKMPSEVETTSSGSSVPPAGSAPARPPRIGIVATPATRKLARDLGVNVESVAGSGPGGRITENDVRRAAGAERTSLLPQRPVSQPLAQQQKQVQVQTIIPPSPLSQISAAASLAAAKAGQIEERIPIHGIRRRIAEKMSRSLHTAAQVTHVDEVDYTQLIGLREKLKPLAKEQGAKLTFMPFIMKAVVECLEEFPFFNSSIDEEKQEIVLKRYYNIGFATDTPNGLIVPVVKDVDKKSILQIARELADLSEKARTGRIALDEIQGGTFTVTNIGTLGGLISTPIINIPEVAILGIQKIQKRPVVRENEIVIRDISFISLSFDHRVVDGADAARFATKLISILENPGLLTLGGVSFS